MHAAALALATALAAVGLVHVSWALGEPGSPSAVVPERDGAPAFTPGAPATLGVAVLLLVAAAVVLGAAGLVPLPVPRRWLVWGVWALGGMLLLRAVGEFRYVGLFKRVKGTRFADLDTRLYTPLCLALAALAFVVAARAG